MFGKRLLILIALLGTLALGAACTQTGGSTPTPGAGGTGGPSGTSQSTPQGGYSVPPEIWAVLASPERQEALAKLAASGGAFQSTGQQSGIWVGGSGRAVVTPDLALRSLGVESRAATVGQARDNAARAMTQVMAVLTGSGIEKQDIRTQYFNIQPEYVWNDFAKRQEITGYRVTNTISVKARDLEGLGTLIDRVADAGGDLVRINSIGFTVEYPEQYAAQAREAAVKDAMAKAQQFDRLTGVTLGKLAYIAESGGNIPVVRDYAEAKMTMAGAEPAPPTPVSPGEMEITVSVQAVFGIE